ncbi:hypothetical protein [uncultured Martelella sp.]|nr:hypothetical protein [uncultured Martelella sp.]
MDMQAQILDLQQQVSSLQVGNAFQTFAVIALVAWLLLLNFGR